MIQTDWYRSSGDKDSITPARKRRNHVMVEISERMECLFSGSVEQHGESYRIEVPQNELQNSSIISGETYRVAILSTETNDGESDSRSQSVSSNSETTTQYIDCDRTVLNESTQSSAVYAPLRCSMR